MDDFRKRKLKEGEESLWEQMGREQKTPSSYDWSSFKKRILGEKTAREVAKEEAEKLKKKKDGF